MAQEIVLDFGGETARFALARVDRDKLYGQKIRIAVDENNQPCAAAWLTEDGQVVPPGGVAMIYADGQFNSVERAELRVVDADGAPVQMVRSTLGVAQPLAGPVPPQRLLDHVVSSVYQLDAQMLPAALQTQLDAGALYEFPFCWREDVQASRAFLLANEAGVFALIGTPSNFEFVAREARNEIEADGDGSDDELDFSMM
jgi:hypothetical protein